ncbi:MAG: hypothetical protein K2Y09_11785 [Nitrosomonas sp.]|uniref:hypothetical protein n=1 Tax=Nitrosomonas sp. TaxID=42353 RepID=UPI001DD31883|nr:hypothetical protein [Nitrosomonas sp.]MBX9895834.1 hypothetical protein [Nitrosomonas sp.]
MTMPVTAVWEALINWLYERITSLHGTRSLVYLVDMSRLLRFVRLVRLVLHLVRRINKRFLQFHWHFVLLNAAALEVRRCQIY